MFIVNIAIVVLASLGGIILSNIKPESNSVKYKPRVSIPKTYEANVALGANARLGRMMQSDTGSQEAIQHCLNECQSASDFNFFVRCQYYFDYDAQSLCEREIDNETTSCQSSCYSVGS